jgi:hypothetical protein
MNAKPILTDSPDTTLNRHSVAGLGSDIDLEESTPQRHGCISDDSASGRRSGSRSGGRPVESWRIAALQSAIGDQWSLATRQLGLGRLPPHPGGQSDRRKYGSNGT